MRRAWWWGSLALFLSSCLELTLPAPPGAGSLSGTLVYFRPGRATPIPAANAKVKLKNTSLTTVANADGLFRLEPISSTRGEVLVTLDVDQDGKPDRQRLIDLATVGAGPGKAIALGQVTLGLNATITGTVLRDELGAAVGGHRGTTVLVPEGPYATTCADDGSFLLPDLPDGPVNIAFFRDGYDLVVLEATARAGEDVRLAPVRLVRSTGTPTAGVLRGRVVGGDGAALAGVVVHLGRSGAEQAQVTTQADGVFRFDSLTAGPYDVAATKEGLLTVTVRNVLVAGGETLVGDLVLIAGQSTPPDFSVLPGLDAGVADAGFVEVDAGAGDAGVGDAGVGDAGRPSDAGVDAGLRIDAGLDVLPEAVITPNPIVVALDDLNDAGFVSFTVEGRDSIGSRPLQYTWESLDVADGLFWVMDSVFASRASFFFSVTPQVATYRIRLYVTDQQTRDSQWTNAEVRVSYRPVAVLEPAVTTVGTTVTLSCANSTDQGNLQLTHRFVLVSGTATLTPRGALVDVTSTTPGSVVVGCEVENTFGLVSARDTSRITFTGQNDAGLSVTVSAPQVVDAGTVVSLSGTVLQPPGAVSASWTELSNLTPVIALAQSDSLTPTFTAPEAIGGDQIRRFRLEVRSPPLCTGGPPSCLTGAAETTVTLTDRAGPRATLLSVSPVNRFGTLLVEFDEPANVAASSMRVVSGSTVSPVIVMPESRTRVRIIPEQALSVGPTWELRLNENTRITDQARGNEGTVQVFPFTVRSAQTQFTNSSTISTNPGAPRAGVVAVPPLPGGPNVLTAVVAARRDSAPMVLFRPLTSSAFALTEDLTAPVVSNSNADSPTRRLFRVGAVVYAGMALAGGLWSGSSDGALLSTNLATATPQWTPHFQPQTSGQANWPTSLPGPLFADDSGLYTVASVPPGLVVARQLSSGTWPDFIVNPGQAEVLDPTQNLLGPGLTRAVGTTFQFTRSVATLAGAALRVRRSITPNVWDATPTLTYATPAPKTMRIAVLNYPDTQTVFVAAAQNIASSDVLQLNSQVASMAWLNVNLPPTITAPTPGFDLGNNALGTHLFLTAATSGKVFLWRRPGTPGSSWELVDGRNVDQSLSDPACTADLPELSVVDDTVFVAWAERCAGQWRIGVARVQ